MKQFNDTTYQEILDSLDSARRLLANECYEAADVRIICVMNLMKQTL